MISSRRINYLGHLAFLALFVATVLGSTAQASTIREEMDRYFLLRDRVIIDRWLRSQNHNSFFKLDASVSSGTRKLIGDIKNQTESSSSDPIAKTLAVANLLNQQLNSEKYVDIDLEVGLPLPYFKIFNIKMLPSLFVNINLGLSLTISNFGDATNPRAQLYMKKDMKMGAKSLFQLKENQELEIALYKISRADANNTVTALQIANDQALFDFDGLTQNENSLMIDALYKLTKDENIYQLGFFEAGIYSMASERESDYGKRPMTLLSWSRELKGRNHAWLVQVGHHHRKRYTLSDGLFAHGEVSWKDRLPLVGFFKVDPGFLTVGPIIRGRYFQFSYNYKTALINPQDKIWVPATHNILLDVRFPI